MKGAWLMIKVTVDMTPLIVLGLTFHRVAIGT